MNPALDLGEEARFALKGKAVTESGRKPPETGSGTAAMSVGSPSRKKKRARARRKRRSAGGGQHGIGNQQSADGPVQKTEAGLRPPNLGGAQTGSDDGERRRQGTNAVYLDGPKTLRAERSAPTEEKQAGEGHEANQGNSLPMRNTTRSGKSDFPAQRNASTQNMRDTDQNGNSRQSRRRKRRRAKKAPFIVGSGRMDGRPTSSSNGDIHDRSGKRFEANSETMDTSLQPDETSALQLGNKDRACSEKAADRVEQAAKTKKDQAQSGWRNKELEQRLGKDEASGTRSNSLRDMPFYAALDLGTNNCRLLIARPEMRGFRVVDAYSRIVRLGEGVGASQRLGEPAMERAIDALASCHRKLAERGVRRSRLVATEACRAAENGREFIDRVQRETGLTLEVVDRKTEARLAVAGCVSLVDQHAEGVILFDIGGGSSEIVWLDLRNRCGARGIALTRFIRSWTSLPVGVVNLAERHGGVDVTPAVFDAMVDDVLDHLDGSHFGPDLAQAIDSGGMHMLGTSGTVTTLAGVHLGLKRYDRRRVDGTWLDDRDVSAMIYRLRAMPYEERMQNPCIGADRADLVLAGCAILEAIRQRWRCAKLRVADRGLREGILTELMAADGVWSRKKTSSRGVRHRGRK